MCQLDLSKLLDDDRIRQVVFVAELWQAGKMQARQTAFFGPSKHLDLTDPDISAWISSEQERIRIDVTSSSFAHSVAN